MRAVLPNGAIHLSVTFKPASPEADRNFKFEGNIPPPSVLTTSPFSDRKVEVKDRLNFRISYALLHKKSAAKTFINGLNDVIVEFSTRSRTTKSTRGLFPQCIKENLAARF